MDKKIHLLGSTRALFTCGALLSLSVGSLSADLIVDYDFDEGTGTIADNAGTAGAGGDGTLVGGATWSTDTPSGEGFSFSNPGVSGDRVTTSGSVAGLTGDAMTVVTWFKMNSTPGVGDRIISNATAANGFSLHVTAPSSGAIAADNFRIQSIFKTTATASVAVEESGWVFLAVTYDNSVTQNITNFYLGSELNNVALSASNTIGSNNPIGTGSNLVVGNTDLNLDRSPNALFDDVQIYNEVLDLSELESIRSSAIPEPSTSVLLLGLCAGAVAVLRRR